jgi:hypothetical protein
MTTVMGPNGTIFKDENVILYELYTSLSTFKEHNERYGPDVTRDRRFAALVIETANKLATINKLATMKVPHIKDPEFHEGPQNGNYNGEITITLFRDGPVVYKFDELPIIALGKEGWYMQARTGVKTQSELIPLADKEAHILWHDIFSRH